MRIFGILFFGTFFQFLVSFSLSASTIKSELDWARFDHSRPPLSSPAIFVEYFEEIANALDGSAPNIVRVNKYLAEMKKQMRGHSEFSQVDWDYEYSIRLYRCAAKLYTYRHMQLAESKEKLNDLENYKEIFERIFSKIYTKGSISFWEKRGQLKTDLGDISPRSLQLMTEKFIVDTVFDKNFLKSVYSGLGWTRPSADNLFELARELRFSIQSVTSFSKLSLSHLYPGNWMAGFRHEINQMLGPVSEQWDIWSESASTEKQLKDFKILNLILKAPATAAEMVRFYEQNIQDPELHMYLRSHVKAFFSWVEKNSNAEEARRIYRIATRFIQSPEVLSLIQTNAVEKAPSFTAVINLVPSIPTERDEFIRIFSNEILSKPHSLAEFITAVKINPALDNGDLPRKEAELILVEELDQWASGRSYLVKPRSQEEPKSYPSNAARQQEIATRLAFLSSLPPLTGPASNRRTLSNIPGKAAEIFLRDIAPISFSTPDDWIDHLFKVSELGHREEVNSEAIGTAVLYEISHYLNHFLKNKPTLKMIAAIRFLTADAVRKMGNGATPDEINMAKNIRETLISIGISLARNESDFRSALLSDPLPTPDGLSSAWAIGDREIHKLGFLNEKSAASLLASKDLTRFAGRTELELDNLGFTGLRHVSDVLRISINVYRKKNPQLANKLDAKRVAIEKSGDRTPNAAILELRLLHDTVFQLRNFYENPDNALKEFLPSTSAGHDRDFRQGFIAEFEKLSKRAGEFIATPQMAVEWMEWICKNATEDYKTYLIWKIPYDASRAGTVPFNKMIYDGQRSIENIFKEGLKKFGLEFATAFAYQTVAGRALDQKREILWDILLKNIPQLISVDSSGKFLFEIARKYNETWRLHDYRKAHVANYSESLFNPKEKFQQPGSIREAVYIVNEIGLKDLAEAVMVALFEKSANEKITLSKAETAAELPKIKAALGESVERLQVIDADGHTVLKLKSEMLARATQQYLKLQNRCQKFIEMLKL